MPIILRIVKSVGKAVKKVYWKNQSLKTILGCPPLHGRDQLLCPSRNTHRYDVCISREQLCDHVVDCPGGEDENVEQVRQIVCYILYPF